MHTKVTTVILGLLAASAFAGHARPVAISSAELHTVDAKTDVLGRHNPNVKGTPTQFVTKVINSNAGAFTKASGPRMPVHTGRFEYVKDSKGYFDKNYYLDGQYLSEAEYKKQAIMNEASDYHRNTFLQKNRRAYKTNEYLNNQYSVSLNPFECKTSGDKCTVIDKDSIFRVTRSSATSASGVTTDYYTHFMRLYNASQIYHWAIKPGNRGRNIGIYFAEKQIPAMNAIPNQNLIIHKSSKIGAISDFEHPTHVAQSLYTAAQKATLYFYEFDVENEKIPYPNNPFSDSIYIGSHSYGKDVSEYSEISRDVDDYVYNTRVVEIAAYANNGETERATNTPKMNAYAAALNVISVGAVQHESGDVKKSPKYDPTSSWKNPTFRGTSASYVKPEIANFSKFAYPQRNILTVTMNNKNKRILPFFKQTSSATPFTAGMVADLMDKFPFYKWHPEVVKALLLTSSTIPITDAKKHDTDNEGKYAMGIVDAKKMLQNNRSRFWYGMNTDFFTSNNKIEFNEYDIIPGKRYRIAISWLTSGNTAYNSKKIPQDIDLVVKQDNTTMGESKSSNNPFELVEFTAQSKSPLNISISRYRNDGNERVILGYNLLQVD